MPAIFLTQQVGAKALSDEEQDQLIEEIREVVDDNDGVLVLPVGWGVTIADDGRDVEDLSYDEDEDDYDDEDEAMDGNEEG